MLVTITTDRSRSTYYYIQLLNSFNWMVYDYKITKNEVCFYCFR